MIFLSGVRGAAAVAAAHYIALIETHQIPHSQSRKNMTGGEELDPGQFL